MFIKIMVIFLKKRKHHTNLSITQFLSCKFSKQEYYLHLNTSIKKKSAVEQNKQNFLECFSRFTSNKICYKTWSKQPFCRKFNNIFWFSRYMIAQDFGFNRNNTHVIVHFYFYLVLLYFFGERKSSTTKRSYYVSIIHKHGAFSLYFHTLYSSRCSILYFNRFNSLFYSVVIVYFRQI